jgi:Fe2+ transport system protein B
LIAQADALDARAEETGSFAGRIGRAIQPVFRPLGYDWQLTVGILTSFVARRCSCRRCRCSRATAARKGSSATSGS